MTSPRWTTYVQEMALRYVLNLAPATAPTDFYFALFSDTADPDAGGIELTTSGYARAHFFWDSSGTTLFQMASTGSPSFTFTAADSFAGIRIMDTASGAGNTLWWQNLDSVYEFDAGVTIPLLLSAVQIGLSNPF